MHEERHQVEKASLSYFDFEGEMEVSVKFRQGNIREARVRPLSYGIVPEVKDSMLTFRFDHPRDLSVEMNGDIFHNLHLFANPIDRNNPLEGSTLKQRKDLIYFGPGLHRLPGNMLNVPSGTTVYVAGGAVARGCI